MKLYEIDWEIQSCIDPETGEIIDEKKLNALRMERDEKLENVALWIKNLEAEAAAYKVEKERFATRERVARNKAESLKTWLAAALQGEKFTTTRAAVSFRTSEAVEITDPDFFLQWAGRENASLLSYALPTPNKTAIKELIKNGEIVPGAQLVKRQNINIK